MPAPRTVPRGGSKVGAGLTAAETTTALAIAHTAAGGELPSGGWLLAVAATVYGAGTIVLRGRAPLRVAVPTLVGAQVLLHAWLVALTVEHAGHSAHETAGGVLGLSWPMLAAHLLAGAVAALALALRRRAIAVLLSWRRQPHLAVPLRTVRLVEAPRAHVARLLADVAPTRGPPVAAHATA